MDNSGQNTNDHIKGVIETLLFISEKPITLEQIKGALEAVELSQIKEAMEALKKEMQEKNSGMMIAEIAGGYQMLSNPLYSPYVREFFKIKHKEKLTKPSLETLAIIAYKQPVTRADIEFIRGVNSDGVVANLMEKELIKVVGRKDITGKPYLYGTTKQFMEYFGLKSLEDLPKLEELTSLTPQGDYQEGEKELSDASQGTSVTTNSTQDEEG